MTGRVNAGACNVVTTESDNGTPEKFNEVSATKVNQSEVMEVINASYEPHDFFVSHDDLKTT